MVKYVKNNQNHHHTGTYSNDQKNSDRPKYGRLPSKENSNDGQHPFLLGTICRDPWAVPEIYLDSIEIEIVCCDGAHIYKDKQVKLENEGILNIIPIGTNLSPVKIKELSAPLHNKDSLPSTVPPKVKHRSSVNIKETKIINLFKPNLNRPNLMLDNCLPIDIVSAPCSVDYSNDETGSEVATKKSIYFTKILNEMKFNESFLSNTPCDNSSFSELLGSNFYDAGVDVSVAESCATKDNCNLCRRCFRVAKSVGNSNNVGIPWIRNDLVCKCNVKTFPRSILSKPVPLVHNGELINCTSNVSNPPSEFNRSVNNYYTKEMNTIFNKEIDYNVELSSDLSTIMSSKYDQCNDLTQIASEIYGNLDKNPEYFEDINTVNNTDPTHGMHYNCEYSIFNTAAITSLDDVPPVNEINNSNLLDTNSSKVSNHSKNGNSTNEYNSRKTHNSIEIKDKKNHDTTIVKRHNNNKCRNVFKRKYTKLSMDKQMLENGNILANTGWVVSVGEPRINYIFDSDCPTVVPFTLIDTYYKPSQDLVTWNCDPCVIRKIEEIQMKKSRSEYKNVSKKRKIEPMKEEYVYKSRPINAINNSNAVKVLSSRSDPSAFARHFGGFMNKIPRVSHTSRNEFEYVSKNSSNANVPKSKPLASSDVNSTVGSRKNKGKKYTKTIRHTIARYVEPLKSEAYSSPSNFNWQPEIIAIPEETKTTAKSQDTPKPAIESQQLSHSIFSSRLVEDKDRDMPSSVCVLINGKVFVYTRDYS